jgi:hypothetical protein
MSFFALSVTAPKAASKKQPIFTGWFFERRPADNNVQGAVTK